MPIIETVSFFDSTQASVFADLGRKIAVENEKFHGADRIVLTRQGEFDGIPLVEIRAIRHGPQGDVELFKTSNIDLH